MHRDFTRENREAPTLSTGGSGGPLGESHKPYKTQMNGIGESSSGMVPTRQPNEDLGRSKEAAEGRPLAKREHGEPLDRTQRRGVPDTKPTLNQGGSAVCVKWHGRPIS
jgi:hypothetical protein